MAILQDYLFNVIRRWLMRPALQESPASQEPPVNTPQQIRPLAEIFCISEIISSPPPITVIDIGAMAIEGVDEPYAPLVRKEMATVIGFDASAEECEKLNKTSHPNHRFFPYFIFDGSKRSFYITAQLSSSSLYKPNTNLISLFHDLPPLLEVINTESVQTSRLDDIPELSGTHCDYLKLDIQGAELGALQNSEKILKDVLIIHTEAEFAPLYHGQPLFPDIDQYLRSKGFMFHTLAQLGVGSFDPTKNKSGHCITTNQCLWCDAVYIRDPQNFKNLTPDQLIKIVVIIHEIYKSFDLCHLALSIYDQKTGSSMAENYRNLFEGRYNTKNRYRSPLTKTRLSSHPPNS